MDCSMLFFALSVGNILVSGGRSRRNGNTYGNNMPLLQTADPPPPSHSQLNGRRRWLFSFLSVFVYLQCEGLKAEHSCIETASFHLLLSESCNRRRVSTCRCVRLLGQDKQLYIRFVTGWMGSVHGEKMTFIVLTLVLTTVRQGSFVCLKQLQNIKTGEYLVMTE